MPDAKLVEWIRDKYSDLASEFDERGRRRWAAVEAQSLGRGGIVAVVPPCRMIEVNDEIAIVRGDRFVKRQSSDTGPIAEPAPLKECRTVS